MHRFDHTHQNVRRTNLAGRARYIVPNLYQAKHSHLILWSFSDIEDALAKENGIECHSCPRLREDKLRQESTTAEYMSAYGRQSPLP